MHTALHSVALDLLLASLDLHWLALDFHRLTLGPGLRWLASGVVLAVTLVLGICVHELLHLVPLHFADVTYTVTVLPTDDATSETTWATLQSALASGLVRVEVTHLRPDATDWVLRVAALLPLLLAVPLFLVAAGVLPDPLASDDAVVTAALVAATACGLPSPADWAVVWHGSDLYPHR